MHHSFNSQVKPGVAGASHGQCMMMDGVLAEFQRTIAVQLQLASMGVVFCLFIS